MISKNAMEEGVVFGGLKKEFRRAGYIAVLLLMLIMMRVDFGGRSRHR